jgi:DNA-binding winged helix-turn-helix (wHTH) protein
MNQQKQGISRIDGYVIDADRRLILAADDEVEIQPRAFDLLVYLLENRDRAVSKEELLESIWPGQFISESVMSSAVMKARKGVGDDAHSQSVIKTLHGYGYRFVAELKLPEEPPQADIQKTPVGERSNSGLSSPADQPKSSFFIPRRFATFMAVIAVATLSWLARDSLHYLYNTYLVIDIPPSVSVTRWPEADALFHRDARWLGGTVGPSVDLGAGRVAWFFGNSYVSEKPGQSRVDASYISNAIGIQQGYFAPTATLEVFWQTRDSTPVSFFAEQDGHWYWPLQAALVDSGLLLFLQEIRESAEGLGFQSVRTVVVLIENPEEPPNRWIYKPLQLTETDAGMFINLSALYLEGEYLYAYSRQMPEGDAYLARWLQEESGVKGSLSTEWWCGQELGWLALDNDLSTAKPVINDAKNEFYIQFLPAQNKYVLVEGWGFPGNLLSIRSTDTLTGTWSERNIIYRPEERNRRNVYSHGIGAHPGLQGADIIATYDVNHEIFSQGALDTSVLYPRFVRINFGSVK